MKKVMISDDFSGQYTINKSNRDWVLSKDAEIFNDSNSATIFESSAFSGNQFHINGTIYNISNVGGIILTMDGDKSNIVIGKTASLNAFRTAVQARGDDQVVVNNGHLDSEITGIYAIGDNKKIINNGDIVAGAGIEAVGSGSITNNGDIDSFSVAISWNGSSDLLMLGKHSNIVAGTPGGDGGVGIYRLNIDSVKSVTINEGRITAGNLSFQGSAGAETLINRGKISGDIDFDSGADTFDGRGGKLVGTVMGGEGGDTYVIGAVPFAISESAEAAGIDKIKSESSFQFAPSSNIEELYLIGKANISGTGDEGDNRIFGNKGNNVLSGLGGSDHLTGGGGKDVFMFKTGYGADYIEDFENGIDKINLSGFAQITDFNDLKVNHLTFIDGNVIIDGGSGDELVLVGFKLSKLNEADLIF